MVSHVYGMNYFLDIYKDSTHVAEYKQDVSTCKPKVLTETVAYKAYCLGNTKSLVTDTKTYDLKIMLADKERDEKNWTCGLRGHKYKSPPLQLVIEGEWMQSFAISCFWLWVWETINFIIKWSPELLALHNQSTSVHPQPVLHDWCKKGCGMCYPVCAVVHIKKNLAANWKW